jgi:hypothetical protein
MSDENKKTAEAILNYIANGGPVFEAMSGVVGVENWQKACRLVKPKTWANDDVSADEVAWQEYLLNLNDD